MRPLLRFAPVVATALVLFACSGGDSTAIATNDAGMLADGATMDDAGAGADAAGDAPVRADGAASDGGGSACTHPKPGPTNTGVPAGVTLTKSGPITVSTDGAIVENLDIAGEITVLANNVTIRNVRITSGDYYPVRYFDNGNTGLLVEDTEIIGTSGDVTAGLSFAHYTARRVNIHGSADGVKADSDVLIEDSWIHDMSNGVGEHNDGLQSTGGKGVTLRHNVISGASNSNVQTGDEGGAATEDLTIECNWLSGGGYTLNIRGTAPTAPKGTKVIDNRFTSDWGYGPWTFDDPSPIVSGNVIDATGVGIPYP